MYDVASDMLTKGKYDEVIARMRRALVNSPTDIDYLKLLGTAQFNKKYYGEAIKTFEQVLKIDEEEDQAVYYIAASYEALRDFGKAIQYYQQYNELTLFGEYRDLVDARIKVLYRQQMQIEAQKAIRQEAQLDVARYPTNTIAVLYFENRGSKRELDPLQKGLAEMLITDLSKVQSLKVVERIRLQKLVEELNFSETNLVDPRTAPRVGRLVGAYRIVKGTFFDMAGEKMRIDALVAKSKSGELDGTSNISGEVRNFFTLEKELVFKILKDLRIKITDDEREAILTIPTENFFAFLQYSRGLDYEDKGQYQQAIDAYSQAVQADPKFSQAKSNLNTAQKTQQIVEPAVSTSTQNQTSNTTSSTKGTKTAVIAPQAPPPSSAAVRENANSIANRAGSSLGNISTGINPSAGTTQQNPPAVNKAVQPLPSPPTPPQ